MGPYDWMFDWMAETDLAVTVEPEAHLYFFHEPDPVQEVGHLGTTPFPEE